MTSHRAHTHTHTYTHTHTAGKWPDLQILNCQHQGLSRQQYKVLFIILFVLKLKASQFEVNMKYSYDCIMSTARNAVHHSQVQTNAIGSLYLSLIFCCTGNVRTIPLICTAVKIHLCCASKIYRWKQKFYLHSLA